MRVSVCVCGAARAQRRIPRVNIRGNIRGIFAIYILLYLQISNYNCKHNYAAILQYLEINLAWQCWHFCTVGQGRGAAEAVEKKEIR